MINKMNIVYLNRLCFVTNFETEIVQYGFGRIVKMFLKSLTCNFVFVYLFVCLSDWPTHNNRVKMVFSFNDNLEYMLKMTVIDASDFALCICIENASAGDFVD